LKSILKYSAYVFLIAMSFSGCGSLIRGLIGEHGYNSASYPGNRVALGSLHSSETEDRPNWYFDRDESEQYYFEFHYFVRTGSALRGNFLNNVAANMTNSVNLNSITLKINNGGTISLTGNPVPNKTNTFRFPISTAISNQLLSCNSFSLQAVGHGIHITHQEPHLIWEGSRGVVDVKRFINYWNDGGTPVNVASVNTTTQRENSPARDNTQVGENSPTKENTKVRENMQVRDNTQARDKQTRELAITPRPPNCCHNYKEKMIIGINANAAGAIPLETLGPSMPSINVEFTKGNFNSEINFIFSVDIMDKVRGGNEPMGGGILTTFNYLLDTRIGQFCFGGGAGYIYNKDKDVRHDIIFGANINYRYPLSSGMYFCVGPFIGGRLLFDDDFDVKDDFKLYFKPNVGVGYSF